MSKQDILLMIKEKKDIKINDVNYGWMLPESYKSNVGINYHPSLEKYEQSEYIIRYKIDLDYKFYHHNATHIHNISAPMTIFVISMFVFFTTKTRQKR